MSLDGFIAGPNEGPDNPLGDGGHRLHEWALTGADADHSGVPGRPSGVNGQVFDHLGPEHLELERTRILEGEAGVTHMHYRVQR
jgi:hypothetical protein